MNVRVIRGSTAFLFACLLWSPVNAQIAIEDLVQEAGLKEGPIASRDFPGWRTPRKIVVRADDELVDRLANQYAGIEFVAVSSSVEAAAAAEGADAILGFCNKSLVADREQLVWVQIFSAGAERCIAVEDVRKGRVLLTNMQKMSSPVIAEHALALTLALARRLDVYAKSMRDGYWADSRENYSTMRSVGGKTLLVVGLGGIGTEVARRADAIGMRVTGTRRSSREGPDFVSYVGLSGELHKLAAEADFIVNALPLTEETRGVFDKTFFDSTKPGAIFVNVGRGASVVTDDLVAALESGQLGGAGLDVTEPEPLPKSHALWQRTNVIITPHVAGSDSDRERHKALLLENIRRFVAGEALLNVVDASRGY